MLSLTSSSSKKYMPYIALAFVSIFWGTTYLGMRVGLRSFSPYALIGIRNTVAGFLIVAYFFAKGYKLPKFSSLKNILITGALILFFGGGLQVYAVQYLPSGLAALIFSLVPFWIILINLVINPTEKSNANILTGLALGFAGQILVFIGRIGNLNNASNINALTAIVTATLFWSLGTVYGKKKNDGKTHPLFAAGIQMFVFGLLFDGAAFFLPGNFSPSTISQEGWIALIYLTIIGSLMGYGAYIFALSKLTATEVSITAYINPIIAVIAGSVLLGEEFNMTTLVALALTAAGVILINKKINPQRRIKSA